jgi:hypothetical protein
MHLPYKTLTLYVVLAIERPPDPCARSDICNDLPQCLFRAMGMATAKGAPENRALCMIFWAFILDSHRVDGTTCRREHLGFSPSSYDTEGDTSHTCSRKVEVDRRENSTLSELFELALVV